MGKVAILVRWPGPFEQTFIPPHPPVPGGFTWNLASIGPVVSEEKLFENVDNTHTYIHTNGRQQAYLYYKLTNEPKGSGELINIGMLNIPLSSNNWSYKYQANGL